MHNRATYTNLMFGFLAGGLAGASVALLLAPQSGEETREAMRSKFRESVDSARGMVDSARGAKDRLIHKGEEIRDETARRVGAAASALAGGNGTDVSV